MHRKSLRTDKNLIQAKVSQIEMGYLVETAFNRDFSESENDWSSDGPALS